ncbi:MAG TPA: hypothetical protein VNH11_04915 [Pirellulales bacterium]|nr:hypothetical protein [Pirellulales bacterium]
MRYETVLAPEAAEDLDHLKADLRSDVLVNPMKKVALSEIKDDLSKYLRLAELENDPRFLDRIERARRSLRGGKGVRLDATTKSSHP